jgi:hypothetical protein
MQCKELPYNMLQLRQQQQEQKLEQEQKPQLLQQQQQQPEDEEEIVDNEIDENEEDEEQQRQQQQSTIIKPILGTDIDQYDDRKLEDGFCYRYLKGEKMKVDHTGLQAEYFRKGGFSA